MKKLLALAFLTLAYIQSFAQEMATTIISSEEAPPMPGGSVISPTSTDPGVPDDSTPIDFIIPFLLITVILYTFYIVKKNKVKII